MAGEGGPHTREALAAWSPAPNLNVIAVEREEARWIVTVHSQGRACCPICGMQASSRHSVLLPDASGSFRSRDTSLCLRAGGALALPNDRCDRRIFAERFAELAAPFARYTDRLTGIVRLFGHGAGDRPSERLMARLGMRVSDTTILRRVKPNFDTGRKNN